MMLHRVLPLFAILAVALLVSAPVRAADEPVEGTVVKAGDGKLTITGADKKEHSCNVAKDAKITCNGKECKLDDLKKGAKVKVTLEGKGKKAMATKIEATLKK